MTASHVQRRRVLIATLIAMAAGAAACTPGLTPHENAMVQEWLICFECRRQLNSLRALATAKPGATVDSLNVALINGPTVAQRLEADSVLTVGFIRDSAYRVLHVLAPLALGRSAYVSANRDRYVNGYRSRGAFGLGWVRTAPAMADLNAALGMPLPTSVKLAVLFARDSLPP